MRAHLKGLNDNVWIICEKGWTRLEGDYENWHKDDVAKKNRGPSAIFNYV